MHSGPIASGSKHLAAVPRERSLISKSFLGLLFTQFLGATNDNILRWLVIGIGKDYAGVNVSNLLALGTAVFVLPYILLAAPAGYLADRYSKRQVIVLCKVGEALIMTAIGLAVAVPAVLGYNWLVRRNKAAMERVRGFGADLHAVLLSGAQSPARA